MPYRPAPRPGRRRPSPRRRKSGNPTWARWRRTWSRWRAARRRHQRTRGRTPKIRIRGRSSRASRRHRFGGARRRSPHSAFHAHRRGPRGPRIRLARAQRRRPDRHRTRSLHQTRGRGRPRTGHRPRRRCGRHRRHQRVVQLDQEVSNFDRRQSHNFEHRREVEVGPGIKNLESRLRDLSRKELSLICKLNLLVETCHVLAAPLRLNRPRRDSLSVSTLASRSLISTHGANHGAASHFSPEVWSREPDPAASSPNRRLRRSKNHRRDSTKTLKSSHKRRNLARSSAGSPVFAAANSGGLRRVGCDHSLRKGRLEASQRRFTVRSAAFSWRR